MANELETLVKYGQEFQTKCIVALTTDKAFLEQGMDVIKSEYFDSDANVWLVKKIIWYFNTYKTLPTILVLKRESDKIPDKQSVLRTEVVEQLKKIFMVSKTDTDDLKYVQTELLTFCKNQAIKKAILESVELVNRGDYDSIRVIIDKASHAGQDRNVGHNWKDDFDARISVAARKVVPTPWECINNIMDGGLGPGELGCIISSSGGGKSWGLTALGKHAMKLGLTVAHYTFELSETYTGLRYDSMLTNVAPNHIKHHPDLVRKVMEGISGKSFIKYFPTRSVTINAIRAHLQRLFNLGEAPGLVLIDYADLMRSAEKAQARHEELGFVHEEIRGTLGEYGLPGWTASQAQRSSVQDDIIEADKIAGAYSKVMTDDFIMSFARKAGDKLAGTGRCHIPKNRFGPDGLTFPMEVDLEHGIVNIFDENSPEGAKVKQRIQSGEGTLKQLIAKKFIEYNETPKNDMLVITE